MLKSRVFYSSALVLYFVLISCSASTGSRYENENNQNNISKHQRTNQKDTEQLNEDFDITPYKTKITIADKKTTNSVSDEIWFTYKPNSNETKKKTIVGSSDGFRVLVLITDNLDEANQVRSEIYFNNKSEEVYIDFEPPFYKVKMGDFDTERSANELRFKLNQQGYLEAKVIKDKINKFE
ncbi:MAG: SPOR domain-containing protein [Ignavibacterium sp.]|nr:SPOR domain-containing protein [Ignavibacterium sp.]